MHKILKKTEGFTLFESVVSISVFAMAMTSIVGVFLSVQRLNQTSSSLQALQQNVRYISEDISKIIRNGRIDYARYPGATATYPWSTSVFLLDRDNQQINIYLQNGNLFLEKTGFGTAQFTGNEVLVRDFRVFIDPMTNPFPGGTQQPVVTIFMELESNINPRNRIRAPFQFTLTTREYPE